MTEEKLEEGRPCNPDDVVCQQEVFNRLKNLQELTGDETFAEKYPQLVGLEDTIDEAVKTQEGVVQRAVDQCGETEESTELVLPPGGTDVTESPEEAPEPITVQPQAVIASEEEVPSGE